MDLRLDRLGVLLVLAVSCSSGNAQPSKPSESTTTTLASSTAPSTTDHAALTPPEVTIAQKWLERLAAGSASYSADFQCGICSIGGLFSITELHGALSHFVYTGTAPEPDGEPWTLSKALIDVLASGGNSSVTAPDNSTLIVHVDMDPFPEDDSEYTYRADRIQISPDPLTNPETTEPEPAPDGTQFIFPIITRTLQGPSDDVVSWAASVRDETPEASAVPLIVPATLTSGESVKIDISRITGNPLRSTTELNQRAGTTIVTSFGSEATCVTSGGIPWTPAPIRTDQAGCVADLSATPGLNRITSWSEDERTWMAESELSGTDNLAALLDTLVLAPRT